MSQIILIEDNESRRAILKLNIMKNLGCNVIEKSNAVEAVSLLELVPDISMIICNEMVKMEKTSERLANFLQLGDYTTPLLVIGKKNLEYKHSTRIEENDKWENIVSTTGKILGVPNESTQNISNQDYIPVGVHFFLNINSSSMGCDIYIRVKKGDEFQYIKRLHSNDHFTRVDIEKYMASGLKEFYISKEHFPLFVNFVTDQLVLKLDNNNLTTPERLQLSTEAYEVTIDRIHSLGIDEQTIEIVEESIKSMEKMLSENNALAIFLQSMRNNKLSYSYAHSYMTSLILHKIVGQFAWDSNQIKEKLTFIAYFHDMSLKENEQMAFSNEVELNNSQLTNDQKKLVMAHALNSATIVDKFPKAPPGVGTIIKEHHGSKSGIGYPETLSIAIAPLSMMFIVVEHFVNEFIKIEGTATLEDFKRIFNLLSKTYNKATYLQTLTALENMTMKK